MPIAILIVSSLGFLLFLATVFLITQPYAEHKRIRLMKDTHSHLQKIVTDSVAYFLINRGIYDLMIDATTISSEEYTVILQECTTFCLKNIPQQFLPLVLVYMDKEQLVSYVSVEADKILMNTYQRTQATEEVGEE